MYRYHPGYAVVQFVEAPDTRGFDSLWCNLNFSLTYYFRPHCGTEMRTKNML